MSPEVQAGLISACVALLTAGVTGLLTWVAIQRERDNWLTGLRAAHAQELTGVRLRAYQPAFKAIGTLSHKAETPVTSAVAGEVGLELNRWFYSEGGMSASARTRGAVRLLRNACAKWAKTGGGRPPGFYDLRNAAVLFLRYDLGLTGRESLAFELEGDDDNLFKELAQEVDDLRRAAARYRRSRRRTAAVLISGPG